MRAVWPDQVDPADPFPEPRTTWGELWAGRRTEADAGAVGDPFAGRATLPAPAAFVPMEVDLARNTADHDPAAGASCPDLVLGPAADDADRRSLLIALALGMFFVGDGVKERPLRRWLRRDPRPPVPDRDAVRAVAQTPFAPWRITAVPRPGSLVLTDVIGLPDPGHCAVRTPGLPLGPVGPGDLLLARVVAGPAGPVAMCALGCPGPLPAAVPRWIRWLGWEDRALRAGKPPTLSGVLARRGHHLGRRILEAAWAR